MEDLTRFGLALLSAPIVVVASGVLLGLIGRWIKGLGFNANLTIIDQNGKIVFQHDGEGQYEEIDRTVARLLNVAS